MMNPGPELDAAVAEAIGFEVCESGCWMPDDFVERLTTCSEIKTIRNIRWAADPEKYHNWSLTSVPRFSTDANDALLAAERFGAVTEWNITIRNGLVAVEADLRLGGLVAAPVRLSDDIHNLSHALSLAIVKLAEERKQ